MGKKTDPFVHLTARLQKRYGVKDKKYKRLPVPPVEGNGDPGGYIDPDHVLYIEPVSDRYMPLLEMLRYLQPFGPSVLGEIAGKFKDAPSVTIDAGRLREMLDFCMPDDIIRITVVADYPLKFETDEVRGIIAPRVIEEEDDDDDDDDDGDEKHEEEK